jgi:hypothetical protein
MRVRPVLVFVLMFLATLAFSQVAPNPSTVTSALRARVADDLTREGVSTVRVTLTGTPTGSTTASEPIVETSDAQGNVLFRGLAPGRYSLDIDKAGYFPQNFPDIVVGGAEAGNAEVRVGDLNITAQRTISGVLKWDDDEPVADAFVHVMGFRGPQYSRAPFVARVNTNARGEFKVEGLRARRYIVFAYQRPQIVAPGTAVRVALPVFYPGTARPETAQVFDLRTMKDVSALSLTMKEEKGVSIEGTVTAETLPAGSPVQMGLVIPGVPSQFLVGTQTQVGKTFRLYPVPPGSYLLFAQGTPSPAIPAGVDPTTITADQMRALQQAAGEPSVTAIPVTVNRGTSVSDLNVGIPAPTPLVGKVTLDEAQRNQPSRLVPAANVAAGFEWTPKIELQYGILGNTTNAQGEFRILGSVKGQTYIPGPGANWGNAYVATYKQGPKDLIAGALPVVAGGEPIEILLKRDGGRIEGKVKDGDRAPWRAYVVLAPRDRRIEYWFKRTFTMSDGSFSFDQIAPGEYDVYAFDRNDDDMFYSADYLRRYAAGAVQITVQPYSSQSIDVRLTNTDK